MIPFRRTYWTLSWCQIVFWLLLYRLIFMHTKCRPIWLRRALFKNIFCSFFQIASFFELQCHCCCSFLLSFQKVLASKKSYFFCCHHHNFEMMVVVDEAKAAAARPKTKLWPSSSRSWFQKIGIGGVSCFSYVDWEESREVGLLYSEETFFILELMRKACPNDD